MGTDCANVASGRASPLQCAAAEYKMDELRLHSVVVQFWNRNESRRAFDSMSKLRHLSASDGLTVPIIIREARAGK